MSRFLCFIVLTGALAACKEQASDVEPTDDSINIDTGEEEQPPLEDGTESHPFVIPVVDNTADYEDARSTADALSDEYDLYGEYAQDESGPENLYVFEVTERAIVRARLAYPEPEGIDNDLHLLADFDSNSVIARDHYVVTSTVEAGEYVLSVDTFVSAGVEMSGTYELSVDIVPWHDGTIDDPIPLSSRWGLTVCDSRPCRC